MRWTTLPLLPAAFACFCCGTEARAGQLPIQLFEDGFECGAPSRWDDRVGEAAPSGPPVGVFVPAAGCQWTVPPGGDPFLFHVAVPGTPLIADLPPGSAGSLEIVAVTYNGADGTADSCTGVNSGLYGVLRIFNASTCAQIANVSGPDEKLIAASTPAIGDLDDDGIPEIVALRAQNVDGAAYGPVAFRWDSVDQRYERWWASTDSDLDALCRWDGPMLHDLDDDGFPEVISGHEVFDGRTGLRLDDGAFLPGETLGWTSLGDLDVDGEPELLATSLRTWNATTGSWDLKPGAAGIVGSTAFADFGAASGSSLDHSVLDGIAEVVRSMRTPSAVALERIDGLVVFSVAGAGAGPAALGDFDGDDRPEIAAPSGTKIRVLDLDCVLPVAGCVGGFVRWETDIQDASSSRSTASAFDFDLDGRQEVVFADECWLRIFDGLTGEVLASVARRSCTWSEGVIVADADSDGSADLVVGSNANCSVSCPAVDPVQRGLRCSTGAHCLSGACESGYCRCSGGGECPAAHDCAAPPAGTPGGGNTCRANRDGASSAGFRVVREASSRWGPASGIWNQQPFSVTNVEPGGGVPATSEWIPNFLLPDRNDFRGAESLCAP